MDPKLTSQIIQDSAELLNKTAALQAEKEALDKRASDLEGENSLLKTAAGKLKDKVKTAAQTMAGRLV